MFLVHILSNLLVLFDEATQVSDPSVFADGEALLSRLVNRHPDVIISDIRMPGIDGLQLLENFVNWNS